MLRTEQYTQQSQYNIHDVRRASPSPTRLTPVPGPDRLAEPRPLRRTRSASPLPSKAGVLSGERQTLIRRSWQRVPRQQFGDALMQDMLAKTGRAAFGDDHDSIDWHRRHFVDLVASIVEGLSDIETAIQPWTDTIAKGHAGTRIKPRDWDSFGESLMTVIAHYVGPGKQHKETVKSWTMLSSFLSDRLSAAARQQQHSPNSPRLQVNAF